MGNITDLLSKETLQTINNSEKDAKIKINNFSIEKMIINKTELSNTICGENSENFILEARKLNFYIMKDIIKDVMKIFKISEIKSQNGINSSLVYLINFYILALLEELEKVKKKSNERRILQKNLKSIFTKIEDGFCVSLLRKGDISNLRKYLKSYLFDTEKYREKIFNYYLKEQRFRENMSLEERVNEVLFKLVSKKGNEVNSEVVRVGNSDIRENFRFEGLNLLILIVDIDCDKFFYSIGTKFRENKEELKFPVKTYVYGSKKEKEALFSEKKSVNSVLYQKSENFSPVIQNKTQPFRSQDALSFDKTSLLSEEEFLKSLKEKNEENSWRKTFGKKRNYYSYAINNSPNLEENTQFRKKVSFNSTGNINLDDIIPKREFEDQFSIKNSKAF